MRLPSASWLIACSLLVAGCAGRRAIEAPPVATRPPPGPAAAEAVRPPSAAPWDARVKLGRPYEVLGQRYVPRDEPAFEEVGIASWYGPTFHGRLTANGEVFDEGDLSAAHRTLPLPSYVEVTNLDNGRRLVVRVNDRGPFAHDRIIDLSRRAAEALGSRQAGLARVRVRRITPSDAQVAALKPAWWDRGGWEGLALAAATPPTPLTSPAPAAGSAAQARATPAPSPAPAPAPPVMAAALVRPPSAAAAAPPGRAVAAVPMAGLMVQVAAFADAGRAAWLAGWAGTIAPARVERGADGLSRVRIGPFADEAAARAALEQVRAGGYPGAWLVRPAAPLG